MPKKSKKASDVKRVQPAFRSIAKAAKEQGWSVKALTKHIRYTNPKTGKSVVIPASISSGIHKYRNYEQEFRRAGLNLGVGKSRDIVPEQRAKLGRKTSGLRHSLEAAKAKIEREKRKRAGFVSGRKKRKLRKIARRSKLLVPIMFGVDLLSRIKNGKKER